MGGLALGIGQRQLSVLLRLAEYVGVYNTFRAGVLAGHEAAIPSEAKRQDYAQLYLQYYILLRAGDEKQAESLRSKLRD